MKKMLKIFCLFVIFVSMGFSTVKADSVSMKLTGSDAALRASVQGTWLGSVKKLDSIGLVNFFSHTVQSDGYRWAFGNGFCYNGPQAGNPVQGYFQYDPEVMHPVGSPNDYIAMWLTDSAAAVRGTIRGTVLVVVPNESSLAVIEFYDRIESDGYRWMKVEYRGTVGYAQYDPEVMHPYGH